MIEAGRRFRVHLHNQTTLVDNAPFATQPFNPSAIISPRTPLNQSPNVTVSQSSTPSHHGATSSSDQTNPTTETTSLETNTKASSVPETYKPGSPWSMLEREQFQSALVHLCIFSETICWPSLFNAAIDAYIRGEALLLRQIPLDHVDLVYDGTHAQSTLRAFVSDRLFSGGSYGMYIDLAKKHDDLFEYLIGRVGIAHPFFKSNFDDDAIHSFYMQLPRRG